jgi:hypothetical protein
VVQRERAVGAPAHVDLDHVAAEGQSASDGRERVLFCDRGEPAMRDSGVRHRQSVAMLRRYGEVAEWLKAAPC